MPRHKADPPWYSTVAIGKKQANTQVPKPLMDAIENDNIIEWKVKAIKEGDKIKLEWNKAE